MDRDRQTYTHTKKKETFVKLNLVRSFSIQDRKRVMKMKIQVLLWEGVIINEWCNVNIGGIYISSDKALNHDCLVNTLNKTICIYQPILFFLILHDYTTLSILVVVLSRCHDSLPVFPLM